MAITVAFGAGPPRPKKSTVITVAILEQGSLDRKRFSNRVPSTEQVDGNYRRVWSRVPSTENGFRTGFPRPNKSTVITVAFGAGSPRPNKSTVIPVAFFGRGTPVRKPFSV